MARISLNVMAVDDVLEALAATNPQKSVSNLIRRAQSRLLLYYRDLALNELGCMLYDGQFQGFSDSRSMAEALFAATRGSAAAAYNLAVCARDPSSKLFGLYDDILQMAITRGSLDAEVDYLVSLVEKGHYNAIRKLYELTKGGNSYAVRGYLSVLDLVPSPEEFLPKGVTKNISAHKEKLDKAYPMTVADTVLQRYKQGMTALDSGETPETLFELWCEDVPAAMRVDLANVLAIYHFNEGEYEDCLNALDVCSLSEKDDIRNECKLMLFLDDAITFEGVKDLEPVDGLLPFVCALAKDVDEPEAQRRAYELVLTHYAQGENGALDLDDATALALGNVCFVCAQALSEPKWCDTAVSFWSKVKWNGVVADAMFDVYIALKKPRKLLAAFFALDSGTQLFELGNAFYRDAIENESQVHYARALEFWEKAAKKNVPIEGGNVYEAYILQGDSKPSKDRLVAAFNGATLRELGTAFSIADDYEFALTLYLEAFKRGADVSVRECLFTFYKQGAMERLAEVSEFVLKSAEKGADISVEELQYLCALNKGVDEDNFKSLVALLVKTAGGQGEVAEALYADAIQMLKDFDNHGIVLLDALCNAGNTIAQGALFSIYSKGYASIKPDEHRAQDYAYVVSEFDILAREIMLKNEITKEDRIKISNSANLPPDSSLVTVKALLTLGNCFFDGNGCEKNYAKAATNWARAAALHQEPYSTMAQDNLEKSGVLNFVSLKSEDDESEYEYKKVLPCIIGRSYPASVHCRFSKFCEKCSYVYK